MSEKVAKLGIKRQPGYFYFLRDDGVWRAPGDRTTDPATVSSSAELVARASFTRETSSIYFLDNDGDISRAALGASPSLTAPRTAPPAEKVARTGIKREVGCLYFIKTGEVWMMRGGVPSLVARASFERDDKHLYFLDEDGDVARTPLASDIQE